MTFIGQKSALPHVKPFLWQMMEWSARDLFGPAFASWDREVARAGTVVKGSFQMRENNYVLDARKMGGKAQAIVSGGFLHHTSFLWD